MPELHPMLNKPSDELDQLRHIERKLDALIDHVGRHDTRLDDLYRLLNDPDVEPYQPIYGLAGLVQSEPRRNCLDRCQVIGHYLGQTHDLRLLDVGSSLGYFSFYFAHRGAAVTGWESHLKNAEAARKIAEISGIAVDFQATRFDATSIDAIAPNNYDAVFLLSVLHHLIDAEGLAYVQSLMAELLTRVPTLILELAQKGENPDLYWDAAQPADELAIFDHVRDRIEVVKLGEFENHLSASLRPLYAVSLKTNSVCVNGTNYSYETKTVDSYSESPMPVRLANRRYYFDPKHIVKEYRFEGSHHLPNRMQILAEITALTLPCDVPGRPALLDYELSPEGARVVLERIPGELLLDLLGTGLGAAHARNIAKQVLESLAGLEAEGLFHNDVRSWNVIYDGTTASLIDYGHVSHRLFDDDACSLLWLLKAVLSGEREDLDDRQESLPPRQLFGAVDSGLDRLFAAVESGERSPQALLQTLA